MKTIITKEFDETERESLAWAIKGDDAIMALHDIAGHLRTINKHMSGKEQAKALSELSDFFWDVIRERHLNEIIP